jgi:hypothetical protein
MSSVHKAHIACYSKFFLVHCKQVLYQSRLCIADHAYLIYLMLQRQSSSLNGCKITAAKFKPLVCSVSGFALCNAANMFIHMVACIILLQSCIHMESWKLCANRGSMCTFKNIQWWGELCFAVTAILRGRFLPLIPGLGKQKSLMI